MSAVEASITGLKELQQQLDRLGPRMIAEGGKALWAEAQIEKTESIHRTPIDTGALRASHDVVGPITSSGSVEVHIVVGGPAAPYAVYVHENLDADHPVGQAKFLESTLLESAPYMAQRLAARLQRVS